MNNIIIYGIVLIAVFFIAIWLSERAAKRYAKYIEGFYLVDWICLNCGLRMNVKIKQGTDKMTALNETLCCKCGCKITGK